MGERIMADIVEQCRQPDRDAFVLGHTVQFATVGERAEGPAGEVIGTECMLEPRVRGAGIDQEGVAQLPDITKPLHRRRVEHSQCSGVQADIVPERIAYDIGVRASHASGRGTRVLRSQAVGPAARTSSGTSLNCLKLSRNMPASFLACASYAAPSLQVLRGSSTALGTSATVVGTSMPNTGSFL